nr:hypothetical protein [Kibdelosporangium sp. MJ126-NF4]
MSHAGLVPLVRLMENIGLPALAGELVRLGGSAGANAAAKITTIVAGMAAGADSISDLDLLREGGMDRVFTGVRAPSTIGGFLRWFTPGHVAQLQTLLAEVLVRLTGQTSLLPGLDQLAFLDLDSKITQVHGRQKQGAAYGYTRVLGLNFLAGTLATELAAPVLTGTRLRGGNADTRRKAASFARAQLRTARASGAVNNLLVRMDSGFYVGELISEIARSGTWFSVTVPQRKPIRAAIAAIDESAWTTITYARPVRDEDTGELVTTAQIAETSYTAFTNPTLNPGQKTTGRLIARRTPIPTLDGQGQLITVHRYHAFLTNSPFDPLTADAQHRGRAGTIEHVFADLQSGPVAHFPSGDFQANAAWLSLAALTHNLMRALACLAGGAEARARTTTLRRRLITVAARISRSARRLTLHLPRGWTHEHPWQRVFTGTHHTHPPPRPA